MSSLFDLSLHPLQLTVERDLFTCIDRLERLKALPSPSIGFELWPPTDVSITPQADDRLHFQVERRYARAAYATASGTLQGDGPTETQVNFGVSISRRSLPGLLFAFVVAAGILLVGGDGRLVVLFVLLGVFNLWRALTVGRARVRKLIIRVLTAEDGPSLDRPSFGR